MVNGRIKRKNVIIIVVIVILIIVIAVTTYLLIKGNGEVSFEANDKLYFKMFANTYEEDEYEFYSLDAYYLEDTMEYYYNAKYKGVYPIDGKLYDIDEVVYGRIYNLYGMYCRSWDQLYGFEDVDKEFERAQKEGIHKTYTKEEIDKLLEEAYKEKENK